MNNSSDFYASMTEDKATKSVCLAFAVTACVVTVVNLYSAIWYGKFGSDVKGTLINKIVVRICWTALEYYVIVQVPILLLPLL
jgi:hypothetical protein